MENNNHEPPKKEEKDKKFGQEWAQTAKQEYLNHRKSQKRKERGLRKLKHNNKFDPVTKEKIDMIYSRLGQIQLFIVCWAFFHPLITLLGGGILKTVWGEIDWMMFM